MLDILISFTILEKMIGESIVLNTTAQANIQNLTSIVKMITLKLKNKKF